MSKDLYTPTHTNRVGNISVKNLKTFLHRDFFEGDDTNLVVMGIGFALGASSILMVCALGLVF